MIDSFTFAYFHFWWYVGSMKIKTSIKLSEDLLEAINQRVEHKNRSEFIEMAVRSYLSQLIRDEQNAKLELTR